MKNRAWLLLAAVVASCGDGDLPDGAGDPIEPGDLYHQFDRTDCDGDPFDGFDLRGIWQQDIHFDVGSATYSSMRWEATPSRWQVYFGGVQATKSRVEPGEVYVQESGVRASGTEFRRAYHFCKHENGGRRLVGRFITCTTRPGASETCFAADVTSTRLERRPGEALASGLSLVSHFTGGGTAWPVDGSKISVNVRVEDGIAYLARYNDGLRMVDVSDPANPAPLGGLPCAAPSEIWNDVKLVTRGDGKRFALMASDERGVVVVDVSNPMQPFISNSFPDPARYEATQVNVHTVFTESRNGRVYAHLGNITMSGTETWDVTDPTMPEFVNSYASPEADRAGVFVHDLYVENGVAYLSYWDEGLVIVDTKVTPPALIGQFESYDRRTSHSVWVTTVGDRKVAVHGDEDYDAHLRVIDVDPASATFMQQLGELSLRPEVSIHNIMAVGSTAYVSWYQDGVRLIDLSNLSAPAEKAYFNTWDAGPGNSFFEGAIGLDLDLDAKLIYAADTSGGLFVLGID